MADRYNKGAGVRVTATFTDLEGTIADPTIVVCRVVDPTGIETTPTVHQIDVGKYYADFVLTKRGIWNFHWEGDGAVQAADEGSVATRPSKFS